MKAQTLIKQWLSSPAHRLVHVLLIAILGLGVLWWAMQGQPVKADPDLIYVRTDGDDSLCTGQFDAPATAAPDCAVRTVQQGVITVTSAGTVIVNEGLYAEIITITQPLTLTANGLVTMTAASGTNNALIKVVTDDVTIDGFTLIVNRPQAVAGIAAGIITAGDTQEADALTVRNCIIRDSGLGGVFDNVYGLTTNAVGIAVLSQLSGDAESVTLDNNLIEINTIGPSNNSTRGIWLREVYGEVTNNALDGLAQDALIQFSFGGATTISGNAFGGAGLDITEPNTDPIVITDNTFAPWTSGFAQSLLLKHNYMPGVTIDVISNTFSGHTVGILSAASHSVTIHDNDFTPAPGASTFTHVQVNTAYPTGGAQSPLGGANSITFTNNLFQRSTAAGLNGTAIEILNENSKDAVDFDPITIGGTPSELNTFDYGLARTVWLGSNVSYTNPTINAYWNDWGRVTVEAIENTLYHQPDDGNLAKVDFYSVTLAAAPLTQRADGVSAIQATATINGFFTPGSGSIVAFDASAGNFTPALAATNSAGQAVAWLTSTVAGPTSITATAGIAVNHPVSDTTIVTFTPVADLIIGKSNGVDTVSPDDTLTYRVTVTNTGFHTANNVVITDTLPDYITFVGASDGGTETAGVVTWPAFSLDGSGASATRLVTVTLNSALPSGVASIVNTTVVTDALDIDPDNNTAQDVDAVNAAPDLVLTKSDGGVTAQPGDTLVYTLTYTNAGDQDATGVVIAETVPANTTFDAGTNHPNWSCVGTSCTYAIGDLPVSAGGFVTFAVDIVNPLPVGVTAIENTAAITDDGGNGADPTPANNSDTITTSVVAAPDLVVSKDDDRAAVEPGETLAYLITITNTGNIAAMVNVTDTLPANTAFLVASDGGTHNGSGVVTWPIFTLPGGGASVTRLVVATVGNTLPAGVDAITNTVTVTTSNEADGTDNTAWDVNQVNAAPDLMLSKSDGGITVAPGDTLVYTLTYANAGNQGATGVVITETVPAHTTFVGPSGWTGDGSTYTYTLGHLFAGNGGNITFTVRVTTPLEVGVTHIDNNAFIVDDGSNGADPTPANNIATTATPVEAAPDLEIGKSNGVDEVTPGDTLIYTLVVTNTGDRDAASVTLTDNLPAHTTFVSASDGGDQTPSGVVTWPAFALAGGGTSATRVLTVTVVAPFPADTNVITNTATVADAGTVYATATDVDTVNAAPVLALSKDNDVTTVTPGSTLIYRLVITNSGNQLAAGIVLTDTLPEHTAFTLASHDGEETPLGSGIVVWSAFDLPGGASTTRLLAITVDNPLPAGVTAITNTAALRDNRGFTAPGATDVDAVDANPDFILTKTSAITSTVPGAMFSYTITLTNNGNQDATGVVISDTLPADVAFVSASDVGGETSPGSGIVVWPTLSLASGASVTRVLTVTVNPTLPAGLELLINTVDAVDDRGYQATNQHLDFVEAAPDLVLTKDDGGISVQPGDTLTYTLTYTNAGNQDATGVAIVETVPAHTTFDSSSSTPGWTCLDGAPAGTLCTYTIGALAASDAGNVAFAVDVVSPLPTSVTAIENIASIADDSSNGADPNPADNENTTTTPVVAAPDLVVSKDDDRATVEPGGTLSYLITITNTGNQDAANILVTDTLPLHTAFVTASDGGTESAPGIVTWPAFSLGGNGAYATRLVIVAVDDPLPAGVDAITNTVSASTPGEIDLTDNVAEDVDTVIAAPDLALTKSDGGVTVEPGDTLVYTLTYANIGNQGATGVVITETVPAHSAFNNAASTPGWSCVDTTCTFTVGALPAGDMDDVQFTVVVSPSVPAGVTQIDNSATIGDDGDNGTDTNPANNTATSATPLIAAPDLVLTKADGGSAVRPGDILTYTLTYTNAGNQDATGVVIAETVPAYTTFAGPSGWSCIDTSCEYSAGALAAGETSSITFAVDVASPLPASVTAIENTASIADDGSNGADTNPANNEDTTTTPIVAAPDLVVSKDDDRAAVEPGETLSYLITITNTGNLEATTVFVTDTLPLHTTFIAASDGGTESAPGVVTWPAFSLAGGSAHVTRLVIVTLDNSLPAGVDVITNTVVTSTPDDANLDDNTARDVDTVIAAPDLALTKRASDDTVEPGDALVYTLNYANLGNQEATGVVITETVPANTTFDPAASHPGWSCVDAACTYAAGSLPAGAARSITFTVNVDPTLPAGVTQLVNTAGIADDGANGADTNPANNIDSTITAVIAAPDLTLTKSDGGVTTTPGSTLVYTLTYVNVGNQAATNVIITETVPAHTTFNAAGSSPGWSCADDALAGTICTNAIGSLPAGSSDDRQFAVNVIYPALAGVTQIDNTASIADDGSNGADPTPADNIAGTATPVTATPDLAVTKSDGVDTVEPGDTLVYQLIVTNNGDQAATGVRITDNLPAHTTFGGASDGGAQATSGVVTWPIFELPGGGASVTRAVTVTVIDPFPADTNIITNTATVTDDGTNGLDPTPENNTATDADTVIAMPNLLMSKDDGLTTVVPGSTIIYRLVITNAGRQLAAGIHLTDTLPAQTTFDVASDGGQETAPGSDVVIWPAFNLAGGASTTRLVVASVDNPLPAGVTAITNTAVLRDNRGNTAADDDTDAVDANPLLFLDKTNAVDTTVPGATLVYTLTLTNNGNQEATGILITDTLPADVTFVAASGGGTEIEPGIVAWPAFNLAGGGASTTRFLTVTVNATLPAGVELLINTARAIEDRGYDAIAQHVDVVVAAPDLAITKTDGGIAPQPGEMLVYTLTYANVGEQGATGVVITETVPAHATFDAAASSPGWTCLDGAPAGTSCAYAVDDLPATASGDIAFAVRVVTPLPVYVRETANIAAIADDGSNGVDTDPANNTASIVTPLDATIDLLIAKDDGGTTVEPGETIVYTLTYANNGDQIAGGVTITETVPALTTFNETASSPGWTCADGAPAGTVCTYALGDVIAGGTVLFAVDVVLPFPIEVSEISNQAVIGADANNIPDDNPDDNTATAITPVITRPDLVVGKDDRFSVVQPDQQLTYIITATNVGTQNATGVQFVDTLPDYVTFLGASHGGQQNTPGVVTWPSIPQLALDEIVTRTLTVMVDSTLPAGALQITNTVTVSDDGTHGPDLNPANNTATDVNIVGAMPDLVLDKTVNYAVIYPNGLLAYSIHVENTGSRGASGVTIIDTLSPDTQFVSASDGGYESAPGTVTWPAITLNVGEEVMHTLTVRAASGLPEGVVLTNTATVSDDGLNGEDPVPENNTDTASSVIKWPIVYLPIVMRGYAVGPDLIVDDIVVSNGDIAITISNQGKLVVTDTLGFWVDLYINPSPAPTHVNQTWDLIAPYGAAWGVDREAIPILPGESRTLYLYDIYYKPNYSRLPVALRAGDIIYVQVDSYNSATNYGVVYEDHEMGGGEYNNIARLIIHSYTPLNLVAPMQSPPASPDADVLPERP